MKIEWFPVARGFCTCSISTFPTISIENKYFVEDGKYKKQKLINGIVPLWTSEVSEDEFIKGVKKAQDKYDKASSLERAIKGTKDIPRKAVFGFFQSLPGVFNWAADGLSDNYSETDKVIKKLNEERNNPNTTKERKEYLDQLYNDYKSNRTQAGTGLLNWWNNTELGQIIKTPGSEYIAERVARASATKAKLIAEYKDDVKKNDFERWEDNINRRQTLRDEFDSIIKNIVREKEGKATQIMDERFLEPLSTEKAKDRFGREWNVEKTDGSLWDKKRIVRDENGKVILDPMTGEPEYENVYSVGSKLWQFVKGITTTEVGHDVAGQGVSSVVQFAIPGIGLGGALGKGASALSKATRMGSKMTRATQYGSKLATTTFVNQLESAQVGYEAFNEVYNDKIAEYSGIKKEDIIRELGDTDLSKEELFLLSEARYKRKLQEWAEANPEQASMAYGQAKVAGEIAENTNRWLIPLQVYEVGLLTRAAKGIRPGSISRHIIKSTKTPVGRLKSAGKALYEGGTEYIEENWNNYAAEKGKHMAMGKSYTFADFDMTSAENIEAGMLGFVLGAGMGGVTVSMDNKYHNQRYKEQQEYLTELRKFPDAIKKSGFKDIITGINTEDALYQQQLIEQAIKNKDGGKARALGEKLLISRVAQSLQTGTAEEFVNILNSIKEDESVSEENKIHIDKAIDFTNQMADYYDVLSSEQQRDQKHLINYGNLLQVENAIDEIESQLPSLRERAREYEEHQIRLNNDDNEIIKQKIAELDTNDVIENSILVSNALENIENLKNLRAEIIEEQRYLQSDEYQQEVYEKEKIKEINNLINTANRGNKEEVANQVEEIQQEPITLEQKDEIEKTINPTERVDIEPTTESEKIEKEAIENNEKDEEHKKLIKEVNTLEEVDEAFDDPDAKIDNNSTQDNVNKIEQKKTFDLLLSPIMYKAKDKKQRKYIDYLKNKLEGFEQLRENLGGDYTTFEELFKHVIRETSPIEAESVYNLVKQAYKEFFNETYPNRVLETDQEIDGIYNKYYSFLNNKAKKEYVEPPVQTTAEVKKSNREETKEAIKNQQSITPASLIASTGEELVVLGTKVAAFSHKIPFLGQLYEKVIDEETGTVEFKTIDQTILSSAKPFLNWNLLVPGKKVNITLSTTNGKLPAKSLLQPVKLFKGGKEIEGATFKNLLEAIFKGEKAEDLIQNYTVEELIEKELKDKNLDKWEDSYLLQRIPVNLETEGLNPEDGLGKGMHEVGWWNTGNIADFTNYILSKNPSLSEEEARRESLLIKEAIVKEAKEELTALRIDLIRNPNHTLGMKVSERNIGVSLENTDGNLLSLKESNPNIKVAILKKGILSTGGKEFDTKGGRITNIDYILEEGNEGASYMIFQNGVERNEFGELVPTFVAGLLHNNTENVSEELREKQRKLHEVGNKIKTAERVFFNKINDQSMSKNVAIQILNRITGKDVTKLSKRDAGQIIGRKIDLLVGNFSAYPTNYKDGQYRINIKDGLNNPNSSIITEIKVETKEQGQEMVSFEEQKYQDYLLENLYTQVKFQEIENANPDGSSIYINDVQPKIILERDTGIDVIKDREKPKEKPKETFDKIERTNEISKKTTKTLDKGGIDLVSLQETRKEIEDGTLIYKRFSQEEQRGFIEGGSIHVEASLITGRSVGTSEDQDTRNDRQEQEVEAYAKERRIWHENTEEYLTKKYGEPFASGQESLVYYDEEKGTVTKTTNTYQFRDLEDALDGITLHNTYFPASKITVLGFGKSEEGDFQIIIEQPFIKGTHDVGQEQINELAESLGFEQNQLEGRFKSDNVLLNDLKPKNVILTPEDNIIPIDTLMHLNTPQFNEGGNRAVKNSLEQDKEKILSKFTENHLDTIGQNLFGRTLNKLSLNKEFDLRDVYKILKEQFDEVVSELRKDGYEAEADYMLENEDSILGNNYSNYRNSVREEIELFFNTQEDEKINLSDGEIAKNYSKDSFEQAISMSLGKRVKTFLAGIESENSNGYTQFGNLKVYQPVDNMIAALQKAFAEAEDNSINSLLQSMNNRREKTISKKTGKSPFDFYIQMAERIKNAPSDLQKKIQYHLYNNPVNMSFIQFGVNDGNWTVKVLDADSKNPIFAIKDGFVNNFKESNLVNMIDSKKYTINEKEVKRLQKVYDRLKELNRQKKLGTKESENLLQNFLHSFGLDVQDGVILSLLNPEIIGNTVDLFLAKGGGLLDILMSNANNQLEAQKKGEELSLGTSEKDSEEKGNIYVYNNSSNFNKLSKMESLLTFNPQISTYIAHKTINKYEQPKFISEHFKKLTSPNKSSLLRDLTKSQYSSNSMILQMLKRYTNPNNNLAQKMKLGLVSLNAMKEVGKSDESGEISDLSFKDYFISVFGFFANTKEELKSMSRTVGSEELDVRLATMPFPTISDTGKMPIWDTVVYNLTDKDITFDENNKMVFSNALMNEIYTQLVKPDLDRIEAYLKSGATTYIDGHDIGARMILGIPGLNGLVVKDADGNNTTLISAITQAVRLPGINGNFNTVKEVINSNNGVIKEYLLNNILKEVESVKRLVFKNGLWENGKLQGVDEKYLRNRGSKLNNVERANIAIADFVVNYMVNQANIQMLFGGDLANYVKNKTSDMFNDGDPSSLKAEVIDSFAGRSVEPGDYSYHTAIYEKIDKDMGTNLSKRLKAYVSPGNRLANAFGRDSLQIMVNDVDVASGQLLFYAQKLHPDKWKEYKNDIQEFIRLDRMKPDERDDILINIDGVSVKKYRHLKDKIQKELPNIAPYTEINNTDAQEYVTWKEHITQLVEQGRLEYKEAKSLAKKLKAQSKELDRTGTISERNRLTEEESKIVFQPTKPLYSGLHFEKYGDYTAQRYVYIKSSSFPLTPELTLSFDNLNQLRKNVEKIQDNNKNRTVRLSFNSANKVGAIRNADPISVLYENLNDSQLKDFTERNSIVLKKENFSIQQDKPFHTDNDIEEGLREQNNMGTQIEDIILSNGINHIKEKIFPNKFDSALIKDLGIEVKKGNISGTDLGKIYNYLAEKQQELLSKKLLRKFGLSSFDDLSNYNITAFEKIARELNKRLSNRQDQDGITLIFKAFDKDNNLQQYTKDELREKGLKPTKVDFKIPIWLLPNSSKFESVLNSIVNKNSIQLKISGFSGPVASQAGFSMSKQTYSEYFKKHGDSGVIFTDSWDGKLKSSRYENGKLKHFQILAPNKFRIYKKRDDGTIYQDLIDMRDYINPETGRVDNAKLPKKLLEMFSFRIPTSSHQSGSLVEIVGFLPHNAGDLIIVPGESTVQLGEDYDIDIRNFYMLNTIQDSEGNLRQVSSEDVKNLEDLENEYQIFKKKIIEKYKNERSQIWQTNQDNIIELKNVESLLGNKAELEKAGWTSDEDIAVLRKEADELRDTILSGYKVKEQQRIVMEELQYMLGKIDLSEDMDKVRLFFDIKKASKLNEQYIENQIMNTYTSVYSSKDNRIASLINQALNTDFAESTAEVIDEIYSDDISAFSVFKPIYQQQVMNLGASGKLGIGVHSNWVTWNSILQQYSTDENPIQIQGLNLRFGNLVTDGRLGKIYSDAFVKDRNGKPLIPDGYKPRPISVVNMENQNSATDNQKLQIMGRRNENRHTINAFALMCNLGLDSDGLKVNGKVLSYPSLFISQPIIREYVRLKEYYDSMTTEDVFGISNLIRRELAKIFGKGVRLDKYLMMDKKQKRRILPLATSEVLHKQLSNPTPEMQWALFENFLALNKAGQDMIELQSFFNIEDGGLGLSFFDTISKKEYLERGILNMEYRISNITRLLGDFSFGKEAPEGYIRISPDSNVAIKPTTYFGHKIVNSITQGYNLWKNIFPFDSPIIKEQIDSILNDSNVFRDSKQEIELKYDILRNMQDYIYSSSSLFFDRNSNALRRELFLDTVDNESLATVLQRLRVAKHPLMSEPFFKDLGIYLNKEDRPSYITYNRSVVNAIQKNSVYKILGRYHKNNEVIKLNNKPFLVNGRPIAYKELVKKLLQYSFLSNQENGAIGFRNHFPLKIFDDYDITEKISANFDAKNTVGHDVMYNGSVAVITDRMGKFDSENNTIVNLNNEPIERVRDYARRLNNKLGDKYAIVLDNGNIRLPRPLSKSGSNFIRQFFQHNVNHANSLPYNDKKRVLKKAGKKTMKDVDSFSSGIIENNGEHKNYIQADGALFELLTNGMYKRINLLGGFGINEFDSNTENNESIFKENNFDSSSKVVVKDDLTQVGEKEGKESRTAKQIIEEYANTDNKFQMLSKLLLPYVGNNVEVVYEELGEGINGQYQGDKIVISNTISQENLVPVMLEEVLHSITTKTLNKEFKADIVNGNLNFTYFPETTSQGRTLARVYEAGWNAVKKELSERLGSEEKALEQINSVIQRVEEARKGASLVLESEEDNIIYRATNIHEYLAGMFFNPDFQEVLNKTEFKNSKKSIFQKFVEVLSKILFPNIKDNSVLKNSIQSLVEHLDTVKPIVQTEIKTDFDNKLENLKKLEEQAKNLDKPSKASIQQNGRNLMEKKSGSLFSKEWFDSGKPNISDKTQQTVNIYAGTNENADLSNFAIRPFTVNVETPSGNKKHTFKSVEQGFHFYKAIVANNANVAKRILQTTNGSTLKRLTNKSNLKMTPEQIKEWDDTAKSIMLNLMYDSYVQNPDKAQLLLNTGEATITHIHDKTKGTRWRTDFPEVVMTVRGMLREEGYTISNQNPSNQLSTENPSEYTNHSGGAYGGDTYWDNIGREFGVNNHNHYRPEDYTNASNKEDLNKQYSETTKWLGRGFLSETSYPGKLVRRDMIQANNAEAIFGITELIAPGVKGRKGYNNKMSYNVPEGGTGYAVARGVIQGKPTYVFNQSDKYGNETGWYKWDKDSNNFIKTTTPVLTKNYAGIGSQEINKIGIQAIRDVYEKTFNSMANPTTQQQSSKQQPTNITYDIEQSEKFWSRSQAEKAQNKVFLFGDNIKDKESNYIPVTTQAAIRGLPNALGIITRKSTNKSESNLTDADFDWFKEHVDKQLQKARDSGKTIVLPFLGLTGERNLKDNAPKLYDYLQQELDKLKEGDEYYSPSSNPELRNNLSEGVQLTIPDIESEIEDNLC